MTLFFVEGGLYIPKKFLLGLLVLLGTWKSKEKIDYLGILFPLFPFLEHA